MVIHQRYGLVKINLIAVNNTWYKNSGNIVTATSCTILMISLKILSVFFLATGFIQHEFHMHHIVTLEILE